MRKPQIGPGMGMWWGFCAATLLLFVAVATGLCFIMLQLLLAARSQPDWVLGVAAGLYVLWQSIRWAARMLAMLQEDWP